MIGDQDDLIRLPEARRGAAKAMAVLIAAAALGLGVGASRLHGAPAAAPARIAGEPITGCRVTDGDTIRCGRERIRLLGIDAPELPGHCRVGRACASGDPFASTNSLAQAMTSTMSIERVGHDRYGRTLALVSAGHTDLSCHQLETGHALYRADWDDGSRVRARCPSAAR